MLWFVWLVVSLGSILSDNLFGCGYTAPPFPHSIHDPMHTISCVCTECTMNPMSAIAESRQRRKVFSIMNQKEHTSTLQYNCPEPHIDKTEKTGYDRFKIQAETIFRAIGERVKYLWSGFERSIWKFQIFVICSAAFAQEQWEQKKPCPSRNFPYCCQSFVPGQTFYTFI